MSHRTSQQQYAVLPGRSGSGTVDLTLSSQTSLHPLSLPLFSLLSLFSFLISLNVLRLASKREIQRTFLYVVPAGTGGTGIVGSHNLANCYFLFFLLSHFEFFANAICFGYELPKSMILTGRSRNIDKRFNFVNIWLPVCQAVLRDMGFTNSANNK